MYNYCMFKDIENNEELMEDLKKAIISICTKHNIKYISVLDFNFDSDNGMFFVNHGFFQGNK